MSTITSIINAIKGEGFGATEAVAIAVSAAALIRRAMKVALATGMTEAEWTAAVGAETARLARWKQDSDAAEDRALRGLAAREGQ